MVTILHSIESFLANRTEWGPLVLRMFIGVRLFHGVIDNVLSWAQMMEFATFLDSFGFPVPVASAVLSVWAQFICSILLILGWKVRLASVVMVFNFLVALFMVHIPAGDTFEAMTPPLAMLFGALALAFIGAGRWAIDKRV